MPANRAKRPKGTFIKDIVIHPDDIVIILDRSGRIIDWNATAELLLGWTKSEVLGLPWGVLFPQSGLNLKSVLSGREFASGFTAKRKDGSSLALYFYTRVIKDGKKQITGILCLGRDVTQFWQPTETAAESERKYQALLDISHDAILVLSTKGIILEVNPAATAISGFPAEALLGQPVAKFFPLENQLSLALFGRRLLRDGLGKAVMEIVTAEGKKRVVDINALVLMTAREVKILTICQDITNWQQKEKSLSNTERLLEELINTEPAGVCITTLDGTLVRVNRVAARLFGFQEKAILGEKMRDILPKDIIAILPQLRTTLLEKGNFQIELVTRRQDGTKLWIAINSLLLTLPEQPLILLVISDLSAEKRALLEIKESEARLKLLFKQVPAIIWTTDEQLNFQSTIGSRAADLGIRGEEAIGKNIGDALGPSATLKQAHRRALSGESVQFEYEKGGRVYHMRIEPLRGLEGELSGTIGVAYDITELRTPEKRHRKKDGDQGNDL